MRFTSDIDGTITALRFYKGAANTGTHVGHLWTANGTLLATATFTGEIGVGLAGGRRSRHRSRSPPGTEYVASYFSPAGWFAYDGGYFSGSGVDSPPLHAPAAGASAEWRVPLHRERLPDDVAWPANYWVDVVFETGPDTTPPTITSRVPAANATGVALERERSARLRTIRSTRRP